MMKGRGRAMHHGAGILRKHRSKEEVIAEKVHYKKHNQRSYNNSSP